MSIEDQMLSELKSMNGYLRNNGGGNSSPASSTKFSGSSGGFTGIPGAGAVTEAAGKMTQGVTDAVNHWRESSSQLGISFNNDAIGLKTSVMTTRMSMDEWGGAIDRGKLGFTALGGTMSESAKKFNQLSYEFSNTETADRLREMGITTSEYNDILALTITGNKKLNQQGGQTSAEAFEAAAKLAKEMDKVAQLTGISRKEQEDALEQSKANARVQVTIQEQVARGGKDAADDYNLMTTQLKGMNLKELGDELYTGQQLTKESMAMFTALGPAGTQLQQAVAAVRDAKTAEQRQAANAALENAKVAVAARENSESFRAMVKRGEGDTADAARKLFTADTNRRIALEKETQTAGDLTKANESLNKKIANSQQGLTADGKPSAGALTTKGLVDVESRIKDTNVIIGRIEQAGNERMGKFLSESGLLKELGNVKEASGTGIIPKGKLASAAERGGVLPEAITKLPKNIEDSKTIVGATDMIKGTLSDIVKTGLNVTSGVVKMVAESVGIDTNKLSGTGERIELPENRKFASGTKSVLGDWFGGDFGSGMMAELHGKEAVIPEEKINEFITDMQQQLTGVMSGPSNHSDLNKRADDMISKLKSSDFNNNTPLSSEPVTTKEPEQQSPVLTSSVTLKDINDQLIKLNTVMTKLVTNTNEMVDNSTKQYRATKQLSPNLNAR